MCIVEGACSTAIPQIELSRRVGQAHVHEISNSKVTQWKLANRHSRIGRNWSRIDPQAKTHVEASFSALNRLRNAIKWPNMQSCDTLSLPTRLLYRHVESTGSGEERAGIQHRGSPGEVSARH